MKEMKGMGKTSDIKPETSNVFFLEFHHPII